MPLPYYVSPEQMMKDKAEYARKGIARGRSIVTLEYRDGILLVAENPSTLLHKVSEIYDRIAFAGVGKYNEFENLRIAGIRHADVKGYSYSRAGVTAKALANAYSQALGNIFTQDIKPFEVEVLVHGHALAKAEGLSKKEAAQAAAKAALARLIDEGIWTGEAKAEGGE